MKYYSPYIAQLYGRGTYSTQEYACSAEQRADGTCATLSSSQSGNGLVNTGLDIAIFATIACLLIFIGLMVRIWRRKPTAKPVAVANNTTTSVPKRD